MGTKLEFLPRAKILRRLTQELWQLLAILVLILLRLEKPLETSVEFENTGKPLPTQKNLTMKNRRQLCRFQNILKPQLKHLGFQVAQ